MKRNFLNSTLVLVMLFAAAGCKTKKIASTPGPAPATVPTEKVAFSKADAIRVLLAKQPDFNTLSMKAKADINLGRDNHDVNMNIRIRKDQAIWASVSASFMGIEVARALITPDSVKVLDKFNDIYTAKPFSYLHQFTNEQVDFKAVQALFSANAVPGTVTESSTFNMSGSETLVSGSLSGLLYSLLFNENKNLIRNKLEDQLSGQKLSVDYSDFQTVGGQSFPYAININSVTKNKAIAIRIKSSSVEVNTNVDMPFTVPKRFNVKK